MLGTCQSMTAARAAWPAKCRLSTSSARSLLAEGSSVAAASHVTVTTVVGEPITTLGFTKTVGTAGKVPGSDP